MKTVRFALILALAAAMGWAVHSMPVSADAHTPRIVAHDSVTGRTTDDAAVSSVTVPSGGADYRVTAISAVTAGTTGVSAGEIDVTWTDDLGSQTASVTIVNSPGLPVVNGTFAIHAASGTVVVSTSCTQNACNGHGAHTYNVYSTVEEL